MRGLLLPICLAGCFTVANAQESEGQLSAREASIEYFYAKAQSDELAKFDYIILSDCAFAMHMLSNLVFNDSPNERTAIKFMGLSGMFREAAAAKLYSSDVSGKLDSSPFEQVVFSKLDLPAEAYEAVLAKTNECNVLMKETSAILDSKLSRKEVK